MFHYQDSDGSLDIRLHKAQPIGNIRQIHEDAFKRKISTIRPIPVLFAKFSQRVPIGLTVVDDNRLRLEPPKVGRILVHHDFERVFITLRKHVTFAVGLVFQQDAHKKFRAVLEFRLERKVRLSPFLDVAETAGDEFETLHVNGRKHAAKFGILMFCKPEERPRIFGNRIDIAEKGSCLRCPG